MRAGRLRHRVRIEYEAKTPDGAGGNTITAWTLLDVMAADIQPDEEGSESETAKQTSPSLRQRVSMRYRAGITPAMRLVFGTRVFGIVSIQNVGERNRELVIRCVEKVGESA